MIAILKKEFVGFFASPIGYLVIGLFLVVNGLFLWVFAGEFNIFDAGFADLLPFFELAPWVLLFLIPAITMRSFSDERKLGTLELLLTKPLRTRQIVLGKYLGAALLVLLALLPTLIYILTISSLGNPEGNWDVGSTMGSYFGLLLLSLSYTAIGICTSAFTNNQIVAFILSIFLCFLFYFGFDGIASLSSSSNLAEWGMQYHYRSLSRGVLEGKDVLYFLGIIALFIFIAVLRVKSLTGAMVPKKEWFGVAGCILFLVVIISASSLGRLDLTQDQRYTLSPAAKELVEPITSPLLIEVFLDGILPSEFKRLKVETEQLLQEFNAHNSNISYRFIAPNEEENRAMVQQKMVEFNLKGANVQIRESGKVSNETLFPWAIAYYNEKTVPIPLLKNVLGATSEERINSSIQNLEYAFADAFGKITQPKKRKVAVLKGNAEMEDRYLADFITTLREYYYIGQFTMDSVATSPQRTLQAINGYDLIIVAQPKEGFTEDEVYVLDQYTMNGGASLWMVDATTQRFDTVSGNAFVFGQDLGLTDLFFKYGIRVNPNLVKAVPSAFKVLASGNEREAQYEQFPWLFSPLSSKLNTHPIVSNLEAVQFEYASSIDTLPNTIKKTVLLNTSPFSKIVGLPTEIDIDAEIRKNLKIVNEGPNPQEYNAGQVPLAVLLEGEFTSVYSNRIKPFKIAKDMQQSVSTKMVVISDGDVIKNQLDRGRPLELGFDKWTNNFYGNKEFLLNAVNYLLDDSGLINIRTKEIAVPFLDPQKTVEKRGFWQLINIALPLVFLGIFGLLFQYFRKRKYA